MKMIAQLALVLYLFFPATGHANGDILVTGDSWAEFMCLWGSFQGAVDRFHIKHTSVRGCDGASRFGGRAAEWSTYKENAKMEADLRKYPDTKVVYLSLGGNDFLGTWNKNMDPVAEQRLFEEIRDNVRTIAHSILAIVPNAKVLVSGYDFGNFKDYSKDILKAYTEIYAKMGNPTTDVVDEAVLRFSNVMAGVADGSQIFYIQHFGLAHYYYGNSEYHLKKHVTKNPKDISPPSDPAASGGMPQYEVSTESLLNILFIQDAYHPNPTEFGRIADHSMYQYMADWLK